MLFTSRAGLTAGDGMKYLGLCFLIGCGGAFDGQPVPDWPTVLYSAETADITPERMECAVGFVTTAIEGDTRWDTREIQSGMSPAEIHVKSVDLWFDSDAGKWIVGEDWDGGMIVVARNLHALAHEFRHQVAYRLTGDAQGDHKGWTDAFEEGYRQQLEEYCPPAPAEASLTVADPALKTSR